MSKTIQVSDETYELIKDQLNESETLDVSQMEDFIGKKVFLRTVTYHILGKVEKIVGNFFILSDASWVASSGRFMQFIKDGEVDEVEPVGNWMVNINSIVDGCEWKHKLPNKQK